MVHVGQEKIFRKIPSILGRVATSLGGRRAGEDRSWFAEVGEKHRENVFFIWSRNDPGKSCFIEVRESIFYQMLCSFKLCSCLLDGRTVSLLLDIETLLLVVLVL